MAAMLFEKAVAQGDPNAMYDLGCLYQDGRGVVQSFKKTAELYTMAAEQGHVSAMNSLGVLYIQGQGVDQSNELAREWWTKAANEGNEVAIGNLKILDEEEGKSATTTAPEKIILLDGIRNLGNKQRGITRTLVILREVTSDDLVNALPFWSRSMSSSHTTFLLVLKVLFCGHTDTAAGRGCSKWKHHGDITLVCR